MAEPYAPDLQPLDYTGYHSIEVRNDTRLRVRITDELETVVDYTGQDLDQLITRQFGEWLRFDRNKRWLICAKRPKTAPTSCHRPLRRPKRG